MFADALLTAENIATVARNVIKPLTVNMGFGIRQLSDHASTFHEDNWRTWEVKAVSFPRMLTAAAIQGMKKGARP